MKRGFTLVEILAVIVLLGIILVIVIPILGNVMDDRKQDLYNTQVNEIEKSARQYVATNPDVITDTLPFTIELTDLCADDYIDCPINNPIDGTQLLGHVEVNTDSNGIYIYTFIKE